MKKLLVVLVVGLLNAGNVTVDQSVNSEIQKTAPDSRFENDDIKGITKDKKTGLIWYRCPLGKSWDSSQKTCDGNGKAINFSQALNEVKNFNNNPENATGIKNWRLPNIKELYSLNEESSNYPPLNAKAFPKFVTAKALDNLQQVENSLWSSTYYKSESSGVFIYWAAQGEIMTKAHDENASALMVADPK